MSTSVALLAYAATIAHTSRESQTASNVLNLQEGIAWRLRQKIRDIEGHFDRIEESALELMEGIGSDEAEDMIQTIWGPFN